LSAGLALDGCGVIAALETEDKREFLAAGFLERVSKWVIFRLDDQPGTAHAYYVSESAGEGASFGEAAKLAIVDEFTPYQREENFDTSAAARRLVFETLSETSLVLLEETRSGGDDAWRTSARYELQRQ
jgi:hypothetical protein